MYDGQDSATRLLIEIPFNTDVKGHPIIFHSIEPVACVSLLEHHKHGTKELQETD